MRTFGHTVREGAVIGFVYAYSCALVLFIFIAIRAACGLSAPDGFPLLECVAFLFPPWGFLSILFLYALASRYSVTVDRDHIILRRDGREIECRSTRKVMRLYIAYRQPKSRFEFSDEPALVVPWMSPGELRSLRAYIFQLGEEALRETRPVEKQGVAFA